MRENHRKCEECTFFMEASPPDKEFGFCRKRAPAAGGFPSVRVGVDWCGDFHVPRNGLGQAFPYPERKWPPADPVEP